MVGREWGEFAFIPPSGIHGERIELPPEESHHLFRVRRVSVGNEAWITDGEGTVYRCRVISPQALEILERRKEFGEPRVPIILCAAVLKGDGNRELVDLATQLGATQVVFFHAAHGEGRLNETKIEKLHRTAVAALKQSGRARLPQIGVKRNLSDLLNDLPEDGVRFIAQASRDDAKLESKPPGPSEKSAILLVGPEGGFTAEEMTMALDHDFRQLVLAYRRLRSQTAAAAGLAFILEWIGECRVLG
ncbi:16S rRNA (uracil(1498)-N(3))-methyltransferase [bacterium]|nr:16S rRNA (uracil(1498)-N(3))-methyltransferase [bacterium]MBU1982967.1 16S rRNA (uracil(1498)-N(3))-methyltransferase [bacterium]